MQLSAMLFIDTQVCCFLVIYLSFCVFDIAIKDIIQSPYVAKVHLLPEKERHRASSSESSSTTERATLRASADKSHTFPLWCERDLKRKALHHRERLSLRSAFSTSRLNTEEEMALIMFWGMFGFGEMVSYISFMGAGGRGCWCWCLLTAKKCYVEEFCSFPTGSLTYMHWPIFLHTAIWNFTCLLCLPFYVFYLSLQFNVMGFWEVCEYLCCSKILYFQTLGAMCRFWWIVHLCLR